MNIANIILKSRLLPAWIYLAGLFLPFMVYSQKTLQTGISFEKRLTWDAIREKAKREQKYIFVDMMATWCVPCQTLDKEIYQLDSVGHFFDKHFVSVKIQLNRTKDDPDEIKAWYGKSEELGKFYGVKILPTMLFFNPQGELVHKIVGAPYKAATFMKMVRDGLNPDEQLYTQLKNYQNGRRDTTFLKKMSLGFAQVGDIPTASLAANSYMQALSLKDRVKPDNISYIYPFINTSKDEGFKLCLDYPNQVDVVRGKGGANTIVLSVIRKEGWLDALKDLDHTPDWDQLERVSIVKFPSKKKQIKQALDDDQKNYLLRKSRKGH
ncbi:Thioredoxin-like domain-containing protein [bacterium A37T11]|nr:Thioredoxin-like domain-containing protein [bacterium A37T11]